MHYSRRYPKVLPVPAVIKSEEPEATGEKNKRHFTTDHLMADLKGRTVRGGAVTLSAQAVKFVLQMGSTMVLARLLTPADFGLVAMVTAVTGLVAMFKDAGLSMATVQREHITHEQVSTLFWINVALSIVLMAITAALAPAIAWFYGEPVLTWITLAIAATFIFGGLTVQHQALLRRQMQFKQLAIIEIIAMAVGVTAAVAVGWYTRSYWALVVIPIAGTLVTCLGAWIASGWMPGRPRRDTDVMPMLKFGGGLTSFSVLNYFTRNADNVIIGFSLGSAPLGIYSKAYYLLMMPIREFNGPIGSVMLPSLSRLQSDPIRYRNAYLRAIGHLALCGMPVVALLFVVALEVVVIVLGPGWEEAATVFRWLVPAAILGTINVAPGWLCITLGRPHIQVIWAAISAPLTVASFIIGSQWGVVGVAAAFSISWSALLLLFIWMACRHSPVSFQQILATVILPLTLSVATAIASLITNTLLLPSDLALPLKLFAKVAIYVVLFFTLAALLPSSKARLRSLRLDAAAILKQRRQETAT